MLKVFSACVLHYFAYPLCTITIIIVLFCNLSDLGATNTLEDHTFPFKRLSVEIFCCLDRVRLDVQHVFAGAATLLKWLRQSLFLLYIVNCCATCIDVGQVNAIMSTWRHLYILSGILVFSAILMKRMHFSLRILEHAGKPYIERRGHWGRNNNQLKPM